MIKRYTGMYISGVFFYWLHLYSEKVILVAQEREEHTDEKNCTCFCISPETGTFKPDWCVYTGVTVLKEKQGSWKFHTFFECTDVIFYPVTREEIVEYVNSGDPMDKAGSYGIQGAWGAYVKGIRGDYNNVVGLPVARLIYETKKIGINLKG